MTDRVRRIGLVSVTTLSTVGFAIWVSRFYPIQTWLFWRYLSYWIGASFWAISCMAIGREAVVRLVRGRLPKLEQFTTGFAIGVLIFGLTVFLLGLAHGLGAVAFFAIPLVFLAVGGRGLFTDARKLYARWFRNRILPLRTSLTRLMVVAFGLCGIGILYFQILSPEVFSFDARWYHLPIAQQYALSGKVARFDEGFWPSAFPHFASLHYAWGFMAPFGILFDRVELCAHITFFCFLATLAQIPVLVRRMVPRLPVGAAWAAMLLFPGIYLYPSNLNGGADHWAGFWALPVALTFARVWRRFDWKNAILCAACLAGAVLTKYTAICYIVPITLGLLGRGLWLGVRQRSRTAWLGLATGIGCTLLFSAPHWLKNWIWYGDPAYPVLHAYFHSTPWNVDAPSRIKILESTGKPGSLTPKGIWDALQAVFNFSFVPNNWPYFHGKVPVFGSLFTLTLPCLVFLRRTRRLWYLYLATMSGLFVWYVVSHYDRYLQAIVPWMAAATAGTLILVWQRGWRERVGVSLLVGLQIVWGSDVPFIRTHNLINDSAIRYVAQFIPSGFEKKPGRLALYEPMTSIGKATPADATVLAHDVITILGIDRKWVTDLHQSRISYGRLRTPRAIYDVLHELGVTVVVWPDWSIGRDSIAGDLAFFNFAVRYTVDQKRVSNYNIGRMPDTPPPEQGPDYDVAVFACGGPYRTGLYKLSQLTLPVIGPGKAERPRRVQWQGLDSSKVDFMVIDSRCHANKQPGAPFKIVSRRGPVQLYVNMTTSGR